MRIGLRDGLEVSPDVAATAEMVRCFRSANVTPAQAGAQVTGAANI